jgi:hypothetical protein
MNILRTGILLCPLAFGSAMATDYSVGIVDIGSGFQGAGTALDLYAISHKGVDLVRGSPYVLPPTISGVSNEPILVSIAPEHDLVYVVYVRVFFGEPIIVQFRITPKGLVNQWEQVLQTGDAGLQGSSISAVANYVIEKTYPAEALYIHILNQSGQEVVTDFGSNGSNLVSGHIDPEGKFYYSCRFISPSFTGVGGPANAVAIFKLDKAVTDETIPLLTSTDPVFVQSECN